MSGRGLARGALAMAVAAGVTAAGAAELGDSPGERAPATRPAADAPARVSPAAARVQAERARGRALPAHTVITRDASSGAVRTVARRNGFLTGPSAVAPDRVALRFVRRRSAALGLRASDLRGLEPSRSYRAGGTTYLSFTQAHRGIPAVDGGLRAAVARDGRLLALPRVPVPGLAPASTQPGLARAAAVALAARSVGAPVTDGSRASLAIFGEPGAARLAWRVLLLGGGGWDVVVDADTGAVLRSHSLTREATARVHRNYPGAPIGGADEILPLNPAWLGAAARLEGPNTHVHADPQDSYYQSTAGPLPGPADEIPPTGGNWNYTMARASVPGQLCPAGGCTWDHQTASSWSTNRNQAATQLFWFVNSFHDHLRDSPGIGFGGVSGSLEGNDPVLAQVDDGSTTGGTVPDCDHVNNASMSVLPDGYPAKLQTYLWTSDCSSPGIHDVNGADDPYVVYHEYTHGMSLRLVTDDSGAGALNDAQPGAMGEAWSDWYAEDHLVAGLLQPDTAAPGELRAGPYLGDAGLRTQPFDCPVGVVSPLCPGSPGAGPGGYTYGDLGRVIGFPEVHADGEIWVEALWDLRRALIAKHPSDGVTRARALITDGMRLSPAEPSFLEARNAILLSNTGRGYGDRDLIWAVFAARGMGLNATTSGGTDTAPVEDFTVPTGLPPDQPGPPPGGGPVPTPDRVAPRVSRFGVTSRRFRVGSRSTARSAERRLAAGTRFSFRLSERADVSIVLSRALPGRRVKGRCSRPERALRKRARCTRWIPAGRLARSGRPAGRSLVSFSGRLAGRALRAGNYRAVLVARDAAGNRSRAVGTRFTVRRASGARARRASGA